MENKIDIVNMSFHTPINDDEIINKACETGIILVSSAGNIGYDPSDNDTEVTYPATMPKMIAVASYDPKSKGIAGYSSGGPEVDTTAPGNLEVPFPPSFVSGTSFASPCVAGILALVKSVAPELNYETAEKLIKMYSKDIDKPGKDDRSGYGLFVLPSPNVWVPEVEKLIGGSGMAKFSDIEGHVLEAEIEEAADRGLVNGFSDGTFKPDEPVTRAQVAAIAVRLFKLISKLFLRKAT
jgi:subtilisin family serine protease